MKRKKDYASLTSYKMSRIVGYDNSLEKIVRKRLKAKGIVGYRIDDRKVYGTPDICFRSLKIAIFIDGDFWHGYEWDKNRCLIGTINKKYWIDKIERNMEHDRKVNKVLSETGWEVIRFWEHEIRNALDSCVDQIIDMVRIEKIKKLFKPL